MGKIFFYNADFSALKIKNSRDIKMIILDLFENENCPFSKLNYIFCSDAFLLEINKQYLKHNTLTDVISFNLSNKNEPILGEIYISVERVKENAYTYGVSLQNEL